MVVGDRYVLCDSKTGEHIGLGTHDEELIDKSTARRTAVLMRYCEFIIELIRFYRVMCCHSLYPKKL